MHIVECSYCGFSFRPEHGNSLFCDSCGYICGKCLEEYYVTNVEFTLKTIFATYKATKEEIDSAYRSICLKTKLGNTAELIDVLKDYYYQGSWIDKPELCPTCSSKDSVFLSDTHLLMYLSNVYDIDIEKLRDDIVSHNDTIDETRRFIVNGNILPSNKKGDDY